MYSCTRKVVDMYFLCHLLSSSWCLYGKLVADEVVVWLPNALGLMLASVQLLLFAISGFGSEKKNDMDDMNNLSKFDI